VPCEHDRVVVQVLVGRERADRPPGQADLVRVRPHLEERAVGGSAQVDRGGTAHRRGRPGGFQELLAGADEVVRAGPHLLGVAHHHRGAGGELVHEQAQLVDQDGGKCLHPLDRVPVRDLGADLGQLRVDRGELLRPGADVRGEQELAARRSPQAVLDLLQ
jgi:hypothetical protein